MGSFTSTHRWKYRLKPFINSLGCPKKVTPIPVDIKEGLVEILMGTPTWKNSKGLIIGQVQATTPKIVTKIMSNGLTVIGRGYDLKLDMMEAVDCIEST